MKLCATVLAFHQEPMAISGIEGNTIKASPCASARAINSASQGECRRTPPAVRPLPAQILPALSRLCRRLVISRVWDASRCLLIGVASIPLLWQRVKLQFIEGLYFRADFCNAPFLP